MEMLNIHVHSDIKDLASSYEYYYCKFMALSNGSRAASACSEKEYQ